MEVASSKFCLWAINVVRIGRSNSKQAGILLSKRMVVACLKDDSMVNSNRCGRSTAKESSHSTLQYQRIYLSK